MKAYVLIKARGGTAGQIVHHLRRMAEVQEAHVTFGPFDVVALVHSPDTARLGRLLVEAIQPIPGVEETLTCLAVEE